MTNNEVTGKPSLDATILVNISPIENVSQVGGHLPEDAVIVSSAGHRGIRWADG